ncbi:hypothetical protein HPP92_015075 [Vanilla planifolia]|uniref:Non-specific lipid-transfer protein n=1 Tax=Vanilla planifolia TaxID=51239 RepID=A0A835QRW2_VANPL|nr:hypothetical protein HPP92_015589 [Vanilla planifolia]KAG0475389.1 hypothetical protein HPP92_015075 [Vanilla planifolia]
MARSTAAPTAALVIVAGILLASTIREAGAAVSCGQVAAAVGPCISYIRGRGRLTASCCKGVRYLNSAATTTPARRMACGCLKKLSGSVPGLRPRLAAGLPGKCRVRVPYPISTTTDCTRVH